MRKIIEGVVDLMELHLSELFDLSDVEVRGFFNCSVNSLSSLKGSPHTVGGGFACNQNNLTSLEGSPHTVGGSFSCESNNLTSLEGSPHTVVGSFYCNANDLISLEGIPKNIGDAQLQYARGDFWISKKLKDRFPEDYIRSLSNIKGNIVYF